MGSQALEYLSEEPHLFTEEEYAPDSESESESDIELLIGSVKDSIDRLFKISIWIRNPTTRLPSSKARHYQKIDKETNVNLLEVFEKYDHEHASSLFLQYKKEAALQQDPTIPPAEEEENRCNKNEENGRGDRVWEPIQTVLLQHKSNIDNGTEAFLVRRIARANVCRRQQFAYWRKHRDKLYQHTTAIMGGAPIGGHIQNTAYIGKETGANIDPAVAEGPAQSVTTASRLNLLQVPMDKSISALSVSEYMSLAWQPSKDVVDFPPPPRTPRNEKFFECPCCFTLCSTTLLAEKAWKAHLIRDLRPYVCTYEECRNPDQLYDCREDWIQHENSAHRMILRCPEHSNQTFDTITAYQEHVRQQHDGSVSSDEDVFATNAGKSTFTEVDRCCPICLLAVETVQKMQSYIALHLERFALFSLPRSVGEDEDSVGSALADLGSGAAQERDLYANLAFADDADGSEPLDEDEEINRLSVIVVEKLTRLGETHPDTLKIMRALARALKDNGRGQEAQQICKRALQGYTEVFGRKHLSTLESMSSLVGILSSLGDFTEAEEMCREALQLCEEVLGSENPLTLRCMYELAGVLQVQGKHDDANAIWQKWEERQGGSI